MRLKDKEYFNIPNILSYIRIILIPVFVVIYCNAVDIKDYYMAALIIILSGITDFADGFIARKFNQITEFGKLIDPIADKLTQIAIIGMLSYKVKGMIILAVIFIVKELFMAINGVVLLRIGKKLDGAKWYGKVSTSIFYFVMIVIVFFPELNYLYVNILMIITGIFLILSFVLYGIEFYKMYNEE